MMIYFVEFSEQMKIYTGGKISGKLKIGISYYSLYFIYIVVCL